MLGDLLGRIYLAPARMRRIYALAMAGALSLAAVAVSAFALDGFRSAHADLQDRRVTLGNMLRIIAAGTETEATKADARKAARGIFLEGGSRAVVGASLQSWLGSAVQEAGAQLQSIAMSTLSEAESKSHIGLSANVSGTWKSVQAVILRIESAEPRLTVQSVELQSYSYGAPEEMEPSVTMQISIRGAIGETGS